MPPRKPKAKKKIGPKKKIKWVVEIQCFSEGCKGNGKIFNTISGFKSGYEVDGFMAGWDGEDEADYCPICGELGIAEPVGYPVKK